MSTSQPEVWCPLTGLLLAGEVCFTAAVTLLSLRAGQECCAVAAYHDAQQHSADVHPCCVILGPTVQRLADRQACCPYRA